MKITKRQLKRIIKEEKAKLVAEAAASTNPYEGLLTSQRKALDDLKRAVRRCVAFEINEADIHTVFESELTSGSKKWILPGE